METIDRSASPDSRAVILPDIGLDILPGALPGVTADGGTEMDMDDATRWLTYDGLAEALGITPDSARRLVNRRKWPRRTGNDGKALVAVPADRLNVPHDAGPDVHPDTPPDIEEDDTPDAPQDNRGDARALVAYLESRVSELQGEVTALRARASEADVMTGQLEGLRAVLEAEKRRADELRIDRDRLVERLSAPSPTPVGATAANGLFARIKRAVMG